MTEQPETIPLRAIFSPSGAAEGGLTERVLRVLWRKDIKTVSDLLQYSRRDLHLMRNFGPKCVDLIVHVLAEHGYFLAPDKTPYLPWVPDDERDALRQALAGNGENLSIRLLILDDQRLERLHQASVMLAAAAADALNKRHS